MTRKEERAQYAKGYAQAYKTDLINEDIDEQRAKLYASIASSFIQKGAEWADEHPKEGLVSIDKVIDWLRDNFHSYEIADTGYGHVESLNFMNMEVMIEDFLETIKK